MAPPCQCRDLCCPAHPWSPSHQSERGSVLIWGPGLTDWLPFRVCPACAGHWLASGVFLRDEDLAPVPNAELPADPSPVPSPVRPSPPPDLSPV